MTIALWIVNALLALVFLAAGTMKLVRPKQALVESGMGYAENFSAPAVKTIGAVEILGALGLVLPLATGILPVLAPLAAVGLAATMVGAIAVHVRRKESAAPAIVLGVLAAASAVLGFAVLL